MPKTKFCQGISDISDSYRAFLIDQWGTLHDGQKAGEGVVEALKELKGRQKVVILVSNAPIREKENKELLKKMGIGPSLYDTIVTPAELMARELSDRTTGPFEGLGNRIFIFNRSGLQPYLADCGLEVVTDMAEADFALITGEDKLAKPAPAWEETLRTALKNKIKLFSAIPDTAALISLDYMMGPAQIVKRYTELGGIVMPIGKPYKLIFQHCINLLHKHDIYPGQTVMVGDSMGQDVFGAAQMEIDSCLLRAGMHWGAFRIAKSLAETDRVLQGLAIQFNNTQPNYLIDKFVWGRVLPDRKHRKRREMLPRRGRRPRRVPLADRSSGDSE
jgi:HAD superfamily hydrolase (TIGR01459 family)